MSTRTFALALLTLGTSALTACTDVTAPTRSSIVPDARASSDIVNPPVCKTGGWNSSTGRCE